MAPAPHVTCATLVSVADVAVEYIAPDRLTSKTLEGSARPASLCVEKTSRAEANVLQLVGRKTGFERINQWSR